jgi:hypothetical protein
MKKLKKVHTEESESLTRLNTRYWLAETKHFEYLIGSIEEEKLSDENKYIKKILSYLFNLGVEGFIDVYIQKYMLFQKYFCFIFFDIWFIHFPYYKNKLYSSWKDGSLDFEFDIIGESLIESFY